MDKNIEKTNVMRILSQKKIEYSAYTYDPEETIGENVAALVGKPAKSTFKTLVTVSNTKTYYVFVVPVDCSLDLKKAAKAAGDKNISLVPVKELLNLTGYIRGGCRPVGMKCKYPTHFDETCTLYEEIAVSAGERGHQMILDPETLAAFVDADLADITI